MNMTFREIRMRKRFLFVIACMLLALVLTTGPASALGEAEIYLETVGGFGGSYIYMTYAYIGVTADAYSKDIYQAGQVQVMMDEKVGMIENLIKLLQRVQGTELAPEDKAFVESMVDILELLKVEAQSLSAFAVSRDPSDVERYEQARNEAWPRIKKLLGIQ
jgi:hypothetical protein